MLFETIRLNLRHIESDVGDMRKWITMSIIFFTTSLLSGCWDSKELNELSIATALGIDKVDNQYRVTVQILNPGEIAGKEVTTRTSVNTYTETGDVLIEAIRKLTTTIPRRTYLSHLRIVVFGEDYARDGIAGALDFLSRDHEMRTDFFLGVAKDHTAEDILKVLTPLEKIPANKMWGMIKTSEDIWAGVSSVNIDELVFAMNSKGKEAYITGLRMTGDPLTGSKLPNIEETFPSTRIWTHHLGVFKGDALIGWLTEEQTKTLNDINGKVKSTIMTVPCEDDGILGLEILESKSEKKANVKNHTPKIDVSIKREANIADVSCSIDLTSPEEITKLEKKAEKVVKQRLENSIKEIQAMGSDLFGFGNELKKSQFKYWKTVENEWNEVFTDQLEVHINVDVKIRRTGTTNQTLFKEIKENN